MIYYNAYKCSRVPLPISCIFIIFCLVIASIYGSTVSIIVSSIMTIYVFEFSFFFLRFVAKTVKEAKIEGNTISFVLSNDKQICEKIIKALLMVLCILNLFLITGITKLSEIMH